MLYPIFVQSFLDLVQKEKPDAAKEYFEQFRDEHIILHGYDLRELAGVALPAHLEQNASAVLYRQKKYRIGLSRITFDLLLNFLFENESEGGVILMRLLNQYVEIEVMSGRPGQMPTINEGIQGHEGNQNDEFNQQKVKLAELPLDKDMAIDVEMELADEDANNAATAPTNPADALTKEATLVDDFKAIKQEVVESDQPVRESIPFPPYRGVDILAEVENVKDARKRVALGPAPAALPSVCMYTFHNTHDNLQCADFSSDSSMIACGFGESYVKVWALKEKSRGMELPRTDEANDWTTLDLCME